MRRTREEWASLALRRERALWQICQELGEKHPITKMLGTLAWRRHQWETSTPNLQSTIVEAAALDGVFAVVNLWARDNDPEVQRTILRLWHAS